VAFVKLKIPVTGKQLQRTSEALIHDIHASREYTEETLTGIDEEETLQEDKLGRWALLLPDIETIQGCYTAAAAVGDAVRHRRGGDAAGR